MTELEPAPTGRPCTVCRRPDLGDIHLALADGATYKSVSDAFPPLTRNAVRRHALAHLPTAIAAEIEGVQRITSTTLRERVLDVARSAREAREEAMGAGHHGVAVRAGTAELQALSVLASLGVTHEKEIEDASAQKVTLGVLMRAIKQNPELGELVASGFDAVDQPIVATSIRGFVSRNKEIER